MLLLLLLSAMILECLAVSGQCDRTPSLKFSVSSWKNESGYRLVAADVQSDVSEKDSVSLTVELFSEKCGDSRAVILKTLSSSGRHEEQDTNSTTVAPTARVVPLPDYRHFTGLGYYKLLPNAMNWEDGVAACRKEGTRMLLVESQEEIDTLYNWAGCCAWVGVHREKSSGPWINILGQQMNSTNFFGWLPNHPSGTGDCMILDKGSRKGTSNNTTCEALWKVICEQEL